ncbi:MAG: hypothetical protein WBE26_20665 [Phycisphaerae bacterium]
MRHVTTIRAAGFSPRERAARTKGLRTLMFALGTAAMALAATADETAAVPAGAQGQVADTICPYPAENCQAPDNSEAIISDRIDYVVAEDFTPETRGTVTSVCWSGAYFDFTARADCHQYVADDVFVISYYRDDDGVPGVVKARFSEDWETLNVIGREWTGGLIAEQAREYEFVATHGPVSVNAGECYWIEISNQVKVTSPGSKCVWLWEAAVTGDEWSVQDGDGIYPPDFDLDDSIIVDLAFCLNVALGDPTSCAPPRPPNDDCAAAQPISGEDAFPFNNTRATTDGPPHDACLDDTEDQIEGDLWYCWTAPEPCSDTVFVATCGLTDVDTRIAVYEGCGCPPTDGNLLVCNNDRCGYELDPRQSMVSFDATGGQDYLIRLGTHPGERYGTGWFLVSCGPPDNPSCPGPADCCSQAQTGGCEDEACCETICLCDPYCCEVSWDDACATYGFQDSGCGALLLCGSLCGACGKPDAGDCCEANGTPGCSDLTCCETVCSFDDYCCNVEWDEGCATDGLSGTGYGAQVKCPDLCPICPDGPITFIDPPDGVIDARQPHPPTDADARQGIDFVVVEGPAGIDKRNCWLPSETAADGPVNAVTDVVDNDDGTFTVNLARPISTGAVTTITYTDESGVSYTGTFTSHPANVNGDVSSNAVDILAIIDILNGVRAAPWGKYSCDVDHSGVCAPADILRVIDLLNGADQFEPWLD